MTWIAARLDGKPIDIDKIDSLEEWQKPDLEVKVNKNGAWMRPFRFGADFSGIAALEDLLLEDLTDFPKQGDNEAVSLRNSGYAVFDPEYAADIRENWPEIWDAGGNDVEGTEHSGDDQYRRLKPVVARNGKPETDTELEAVKRREAWAARHFANNRLAGVVALMKWFVVGKIGEKGMKDVMEAQKYRLKKRLEDRSPAILLQAPRNVRQHLHDGLGFVDDTVDAMAAATPEVMDDVTGQILKVLADSKDYSDAKQRLLAAFPTFDRSQLRNMLTGGILIAQAMGMESVQRETAGEKVLRMSAGLPHLPRILPL